LREISLLISHCRAALYGVLETTDRKAVVLVVVLVHVLVAVVEVLVVGVIAIILCRTPEVGVGTHVVEITIVVPVTGRENREFRNQSMNEHGRFAIASRKCLQKSLAQIVY